MPDAIHLYRRFLTGQPGTCIFTGQAGCHAFVTEDEIEATAGSRHDLHHFVWLDQRPGKADPHGWVSSVTITSTCCAPSAVSH